MKKFLTNSLGILDLVAWALVLIFFLGSALFFAGNVPLAAVGAAGIIVDMLCIGFAIEILIECLKNNKSIGTLTGFITNGPEAVCLLVGLLVGDIVFAASTPLGSNFINPILLFIAAGICRQVIQTFAIHRIYTAVTVGSTAIFAGSFFLLNPSHYIFWLSGCVLTTLILFFFRPKEEEIQEKEEHHHFKPSYWIIPAILVLTVSGYCLDPIVSFAAHHSHAPKGVIGFVVLATLTSWPEFKSCLVLLNRGKPLAAILNITVSNITNIWLAAIGIATYLLVK
ncbi:sodium:proton exchanger [Desulfopila sp. IMCC35006]|uniref:sodium:proton exchanger n=1 Tax=Desulfopila sp. IMCC35006 TaxID=2569542 RepID=UPI0010AB5058|nr:sodium:proton exchanger [Desulfopila sp. IMCC35006]TKB28086.1 sodium:proton exchanger [Desulfopila sp. IMCC35006]